MRRPRLGEVFGGDDAVQRRCQHARRQRALGVALLGAAGVNRAWVMPATMPETIASTADAESRKAAERSDDVRSSGTDADAALSAIT